MLLTLLEMITAIVILGVVGLELIWGPRVPAKRAHAPGQAVHTKRGRAGSGILPLVRRAGLPLTRANIQRKPTAITRTARVPAV